LIGRLREHGVEAAGGAADRGAFVIVRDANAVGLAAALEARGIHSDARGPYLRLCPDVLTTETELESAARGLAEARAQ